MKLQKYIVLKTREIRGTVHAIEGEIVHEVAKYDYGLANDDSRTTGIEHISVSKHGDGDYPYFTIPKKDLKAID